MMTAITDVDFGIYLLHPLMQMIQSMVKWVRVGMEDDMCCTLWERVHVWMHVFICYVVCVCVCVYIKCLLQFESLMRYLNLKITE